MTVNLRSQIRSRDFPEGFKSEAGFMTEPKGNICPEMRVNPFILISAGFKIVLYFGLQRQSIVKSLGSLTLKFIGGAVP